MNNIVLVGFMGSGKSTVGRQLARRMERPFVDLDNVIEADAGQSVAEIFSSRIGWVRRPLGHQVGKRRCSSG